MNEISYSRHTCCTFGIPLQKICYIYLLYSYVRHPWLHVIFSITYSNSSANDLVRVLLKNFIKSEKTPAELTRVTNGGWFCKYLSAVQEFSFIFIEQVQYTEGWWHFTVYKWILGENWKVKIVFHKYWRGTSGI